MKYKLFEIESEAREICFFLETYKGNRIAAKLMRSLKERNIFEVKDTPREKESRTFEIHIFTNEEFIKVMLLLKSEIAEIMFSDTPENYFFDFTDKKLGFVNSFKVYSSDGVHFEVCHRIKERKQNTKLPTKRIIL